MRFDRDAVLDVKRTVESTFPYDRVSKGSVSEHLRADAHGRSETLLYCCGGYDVIRLQPFN
eukprot:scaffold11674_cov85-Cylindrotheca_fusiformis.AAC.1